MAAAHLCHSSYRLEGGRERGRERWREGGTGAGREGFRGVRRSLQQKHTFVFYLLYLTVCTACITWVGNVSLYTMPIKFFELNWTKLRGSGRRAGEQEVGSERRGMHFLCNTSPWTPTGEVHHHAESIGFTRVERIDFATRCSLCLQAPSKSRTYAFQSSLCLLSRLYDRWLFCNVLLNLRCNNTQARANTYSESILFAEFKLTCFCTYFKHWCIIQTENVTLLNFTCKFRQMAIFFWHFFFIFILQAVL